MFKRIFLLLLLVPTVAFSADYTFVQNNFTAGELSPKIYQGRSDLEKYYTGAETMLNFVPLPQGGVVRRPGWEYIATAKTSTGDVRLIPFIFSPSQAYIIEATNGTFRFFSDGGQIVSTTSEDSLLLHMDGKEGGTTFTDSGTTGHTVTANGNARTNIYTKKFGTASGYFDGVGDYLSISDHADFDFSSNQYFTIDAWVNVQQAAVPGVQRPIYYQETDNDNYIYFYLYTTTTNTWSLNFEIKEGGTNVVSLGSSTAPITSGTWAHVCITRGVNDVYSNWQLSVNGVQVDSDVDTSDPANYTGDILIGSEANGGVNYAYQGYIDEFRVVNGAASYEAPFTPPSAPYTGTGTAYEISSNYSESSLSTIQWAQSYDVLYMVDKAVAPQKLTRTGHASWSVANVSFTAAPGVWGAGDYPGAVTFYQDHMYYAGSVDYPSRIWVSQLSSYDDMTTGTDDDDGFAINLLSTSSESIRWMVPMRKLIIGTDTSIWWLSGDTQDAITPTAKSARRDIFYGAAFIPPVLVGSTLLFAQSPGEKLRDIQYVWENDILKAKDLTVLSDHLFKDYKIEEMAYQEVPYQTLWVLREDHQLVSLTYMPEHEVVAWSRHETDGDIISIAVIPHNGVDELWAAIRRDIDGTKYTYIERMAPFDFGDDIADAKYLDSFLVYEGGAAGSVTGVDHLEGETVTAYRSYDYVSKTVDSGTVSLQPEGGLGYTYTKAVVGLPYYSDLKTISPISNDTKKRITPLTTKRFTSLSAFVRDSYGGQYGIDSSHLYDWITGTTTSAGESGLIDDKTISASWLRHPTVFIRTNEPYPLNIDSVMIEMEVGD